MLERSCYRFIAADGASARGRKRLGPPAKRLRSRAAPEVCNHLPVRSSIRRKPATILLTVERRCLVCDFVEQITEPEHTDEIGPPCARCQAPTERTAIVARRTAVREPNPHAAALGRLGGLKGGPARAAALSAKRRRAIARAAARARWDRSGN